MKKIVGIVLILMFGAAEAKAEDIYVLIPRQPIYGPMTPQQPTPNYIQQFMRAREEHAYLQQQQAFLQQQQLQQQNLQLQNELLQQQIEKNQKNLK